MSNTKIHALMGASALALALGVSAAADAQVTNPPTKPATSVVFLNGGGSTLVQPYLRQAEDCFGTQFPTYETTPVATTEPYYDFNGATGARDCNPADESTPAEQAPDPDVTLRYQGVGSGGGIAGVYSNSGKQFNAVGGVAANYLSGGSSGSAVGYSAVAYGASDLPLGANDVAVYDLGGTSIPTPAKSVSIAGTNNPSGAYPNPLSTYGPLVQYPLLIAPVTIAYSPIYEQVLASGVTTSYSFHLATGYINYLGVRTAVPALHLDAKTYCEIFNGYITDWNDSRIAAINTYVASHGTARGGPPTKSFPSGSQLGIYVGGVFFKNGSTVTSIEDPNDPTAAASWSVPIQLVGRSDSSGTTGIFTRHLDAECSKVLPSGETNHYVGGPLLPTSLGASPTSKTNVTNAPGSGLFTTQNGSGAVASFTAFTPPSVGTPTVISGKIAYLGPDYVNPYSATATGLYPAELQNNIDTQNSTTGKPVFLFPTPTTAFKAFGAVSPPESDPATGAYVPDTVHCPGGSSVSATASCRAYPYSWVEPLANSSPLATPADTLTGAYPITGTSNILAYTCYADTAAGSVNNVGVQMNQFLTWYDTNGVVVGRSAVTPGILAARGFADLPTAWKTAVKATFLVPTTTVVAPATATTTTLQLWVSSKSDIPSLTVNPRTGLHTGKPQFAHNPTCDTVPGAPLVTAVN